MTPLSRFAVVIKMAESDAEIYIHAFSLIATTGSRNNFLNIFAFGKDNNRYDFTPL